MIGKTRKPKFELHLKIYDLNNVPLVTGNSYIKWHLVHSMHAEHRGRTHKCPIINHRVDFAFHKHVPSIRISVDKASHLTECPLELEILQEFAGAEKITLGFVRLNLSEYVEESETFVKDVTSPPRKRSSSTGVPPNVTAAQELGHDKAVEDGIIRRYLMQDSKVNSTLRVGILMFQIDGDRNFIAPPLRTAPVFGGIAGLVPPEQMEEDMSQLPSIAKPQDASEIQDLYRRTLAASWYSQPQELPADECIEDIFGGGNGWCTKQGTSAQASDDDENDESQDTFKDGTLRPSDFRRMAQQQQQQQQQHSSSRFHFHRRHHSGSSDKSVSTVKGGRSSGPTFTTRQSSPRLRHEASSSSSGGGARDPREEDHHHHHHHAAAHSRAGSFASLTPTMGSDSSGGRDRDGGSSSNSKRMKEIREMDAREDLVAWTLPGVTA